MMTCTACEAQHFPRTDPAVIMLVTRGDHALLGHSQRFPRSNMYSTLAGFVEPGETLEEAVRREVFEESGIKVGEVQYHSSQPWPFPGNIMLGFYGEGLSEDITIDPEEMLDVRWFSREQMRQPRGARLPAAARRQHRAPADRGLDGRRVRLRFVPVLAFGLAACSTDNSPLAQCEQQAMQDPAVQEIYTRRPTATTRFPGCSAIDLLAAKKQATVRCLRAKGLAPPGGVQPVAPR